MAADAAPGWFGKLAMLGDFASRRLDPGCVRTCDQWLSAGLQASRQALGERWVQAYLAAPAWRFAWGPGIVDARWWFGVLMPSCDSVGRYYPLLVAQARARPPADRIALDHLELWWRQLLHAGLTSLGDGAAEGLAQRLAGASAWWPAGEPGTGGSCSLVSGLPPPAALTEMLLGRW
ncbi:type VI secretion system-associated protein TagF [Rubrivivax gelatinosus]|nr:type VI secretion system-associated protein TagF [Rubrivivax gelatinosus]